MEAVLATKPDCLVYCAMGDTRPIGGDADVMRGLSAGVNVVGSAPGGLQFPWGGLVPDKYIEKVEAAARQGNSSVFITGVDPGFATDLVPFALAGTCQRIEQIRTMEIADYATYDGDEVMSEVMGFGKPLDQPGLLFQPGVLAAAWGTAIRMLAAGLGIEIDEITESYELEPAPEDIEVAAGTIAKGTVAAMRFEINGMVRGQARRRRRAHHPGAGRPATGLGATGAAGRLVPRRDHRRTLVRRRHLSDKQPRRSQLRGDPGGRRADRQRDPRRRGGAAGPPHHAGHAAGDRERCLTDPQMRSSASTLA